MVTLASTPSPAHPGSAQLHVPDGSHWQYSGPHPLVVSYVHDCPTEGQMDIESGAAAGHAGGGGQSMGAQTQRPSSHAQLSPPQPSIVVYPHWSVSTDGEQALPAGGSFAGQVHAVSVPTHAHAPPWQTQSMLAPSSQ